MIFTDERIYTIIRDKNGKLIQRSFPLKLDFTPTDSQLKDYFDYSVSLGEQYASCLSRIAYNQPIPYISKSHRERALAYIHTISQIEDEHDVVAFSHRKGGWRTFEWKFNEDITFEICSNFGYGSCSYLYSKFFYKGLQLTPYSLYIKYRYADYSDICRYTHNYALQMSSWQKVMNDTLVFYNAVELNQEHEVFRWLKSELHSMVNGLNSLFDCRQTYWFSNPNSNERIPVSGDELVEAKAEKISGSIEFLNNIAELPTEVIPKDYIESIKSLITRFREYANVMLERYSSELELLNVTKAEIKSTSVMTIYDKMYARHYFKDKWHLSANKRKMIRYLLTIRNRLNLSLTTSAIRTLINELKVQQDKYSEILREIYSKEHALNVLKEAATKIDIYNGHN